MKLIEAHVLRDFFLDKLDDAKYMLSNAGVYEVNDINYRDLMFLEYAFYNEAIYTVPNTEQEFKTPGIFAVDGGAIINNPNYECYAQDVAFEFLGFEEQRDAFRKLLEMFTSLVRGMSFNVWYNSVTGEFTFDDPRKKSWTKYSCAVDTELPVLSECVNQSGFERFQAYVNFTITVMVDIELTNDTPFIIDGEVIPVTSLAIVRKKIKKTFNVRTEEMQSYAENQELQISFVSVVKKSSPVYQKIKRNIQSRECLNDLFIIEYDGYSYRMYLENGSIMADTGTPKQVQCSFSILKEM